MVFLFPQQPGVNMTKFWDRCSLPTSLTGLNCPFYWVTRVDRLSLSGRRWNVSMIWIVGMGSGMITLNSGFNASYPVSKQVQDQSLKVNGGETEGSGAEMQ
jgi:hypothetical protein